MMAESWEHVRAALCSLSYAGPTEARPVHIHRLAWFLTQSDPAIDTLGALRGLQAVREAQPIAGGYWLPTPTRCVPFNEHRMLVSALPREEIVRRWHISPFAAGISRIVASAPADIPTETFDRWLGAPVDTKRWAAQLFEDARLNLLVASLPLGELELYFRPAGSSAPAWVAAKRAISSIGSNQLVLCRPIGDGATTGPFIARCSGARLTHQARIRPADQRRLQWGASVMLGYRARSRVHTRDNFAVFELSQDLPNEEFRLMRALGSYRRIGRGSTRFELRTAYLPAVRSTVARLGLDI